MQNHSQIIRRTIEHVKVVYWRGWWAVVDWRRRQVVREIGRLMHRCDVLYIHAYESEDPTWIVHRASAGPLAYCAVEDTNHDHIEGPRRRTGRTDFRATARAGRRPRLTLPSYWFRWIVLRIRRGRLICRDDVHEFTFRDYRKIVDTRISDEVLPAGTQVQSLECVHKCSVPSRLAMDIAGNVYLVEESMFASSYEVRPSEPSIPN